MTPQELIESVRRIKGRRRSDQDSLAVLSDALSTFVLTTDNCRVDLPRATSGLYTRLLLNDHHDPFQVVLVLWGPHSQSPIHDHNRTVGAVAALTGMTYETKFKVADGYLVEGVTTRLMDGRVTPILPDDENQLHDMSNPTDKWAITVHIYLTPITDFFIYHRRPGGAFTREARELWFDEDNAWRMWTGSARPAESVPGPGGDRR